MKKRGTFWVLWGVLIAVLLVCVAVVLANVLIIYSARSHIIDSTDVPSARVAIVLGANLNKDGSPSLQLQDRLDAALGLYYTGKVKKLLLTGNASPSDHQVDTMLAYVLEKGVPEQDAFTDYAGYDTYDSMYRAAKLYEVKDALVITQAYHLSRAVYLARQLGIDATGVPANLHSYADVWRDYARDCFAAVKAVLEMHVTHPQPAVPAETIPITGDGRASWD